MRDAYVLPIDGKQLFPLAGAGSKAPGAAEPGSGSGSGETGKTFDQVFSDEAPAPTSGAESSARPRDEGDGGKNLQSDGESLPPGGQSVAEAEADGPAEAGAVELDTGESDTVAIDVPMPPARDQPMPDDAAPVDELALFNRSSAEPAVVPYQPATSPSQRAPAAADPLQALDDAPMHPAAAANLPQRPAPAVLAGDGAVDGFAGLQGAVPAAEWLARRPFAASSTAQPPPAVNGQVLASRDLPVMPAVAAMPNLADVVAQAGNNSGNERALADFALPDGLLARSADTPQQSVSTTAAPLLGQSLLGATDAAGELQLAQRADASALLPRPGQQAWNGEFAGRLTMMVKNGVQEASLQLNPAELGRLEIQIATDGDQTRVHFLVQNAAARDAIEQAMPRLREMLEQSGLQLAQSDVSDQSHSQGRERSFAGDNNGEAALLNAALAPEEALGPLRSLQGRSMIDHYV